MESSKIVNPEGQVCSFVRLHCAHLGTEDLMCLWWSVKATVPLSGLAGGTCPPKFAIHIAVQWQLRKAQNKARDCVQKSIIFGLSFDF